MKGQILWIGAALILAGCSSGASFVGRVHVGSGTNCYWAYHPKAQVWTLEGTNYPLNPQGLPEGTPPLDPQRAEQLAAAIRRADERAYRTCWRLQRTNQSALQDQLKERYRATIDWMQALREALEAGDQEQIAQLEQQLEPEAPASPETAPPN